METKPTPLSNLKKFRTGSLLTQKQLAEAVGIAPRTLIRWEAGQGEPSLSDLFALAKFFNVSISDFVDDPLRPGQARPAQRVADLSGGDLDYWIAKVKGIPVALVDGAPVVYEAGFGHRPAPRFSSDLSLAEPLMHRKGVYLYSVAAGSEFDGEKTEAEGWVARCHRSSIACWGATVAEAGMRAWLADEVGPNILA
jgi:transcriptional regulator with XRE-family HTH domain